MNTKNWIHAAVIALAVGGAIHLDAQPAPAGAFAARSTLRETNAGWEQLNRELTGIGQPDRHVRDRACGSRQNRLSSAATATQEVDATADRSRA